MRAAEIQTLISGALSDSLHGLWSDDDTQWLAQIAADLAERKALQAVSAGPAAERYRQDIEAILDTVVSRATLRYMAVYAEGLEAFSAVLKGLVKILVSAVLA